MDERVLGQQSLGRLLHGEKLEPIDPGWCRPESRRSRKQDHLAMRGAYWDVWSLDAATLQRAFALMEQYADHPMDLADASLIVAAEALATTKVFTIDRQDFQTCWIRRGHRSVKVELSGN